MPEIRPGRYRHYKGNEYTVLGIAGHSETLEELVVYRQEYGDHGLGGPKVDRPTAGLRARGAWATPSTMDGRLNVAAG